MVMGTFQAGPGEHGASRSVEPEEISLLMDGELDVARVDTVCIGLTNALRLDVERYHVIGDALQTVRHALGFRPFRAPGLGPTVLAPPRRAGSSHRARSLHRRRRQRGRLGRVVHHADAADGDHGCAPGRAGARRRRPSSRRQRVSARAPGIFAFDRDPGRSPLFARGRRQRTGCAPVVAPCER